MKMLTREEFDRQYKLLDQEAEKQWIPVASSPDWVDLRNPLTRDKIKEIVKWK